MSRKQKKKNPVPVVQEKKENISANARGKRLLIIFVSALLGAVILFGAVFGIIIGVRNASYVMRYDNVGIDTGVASYLISYYKKEFLSIVDSAYGAYITVSDTPEFWNSKRSLEGLESTWGELFEYEVERNLKMIIAANVLFDTRTEFSDADKNAVKIAAEEVLSFRHNGSESDFNEATAIYSFDYKDFEKATEMLYKYTYVKAKIFGSNGENMVSNSEFCQQFFAGYKRVKLLFVRTDTKFELDANGNRVKGEDGNDKLISLTEEEKAERARRIEEIRTTVSGINSGKVAIEMFDKHMSDYDEGDRAAHSGYYFKSGTAFTKEFSEKFHDIVDAAYSLEIGEAKEVECSFGVCFVLREANVAGAYTNTKDGWCFSDFYYLAANELYYSLLEELTAEVEVKEKKWSSISPIDIPYNYEYVARF